MFGGSTTGQEEKQVDSNAVEQQVRTVEKK